MGQASTAADVTEEDGCFVVHVEGEAYAIRVEEETRYIIRTRGGAAAAGGQVLKAPMPGRVVLVEVAVGPGGQAGRRSGHSGGHEDGERVQGRRYGLR